MNDITVIAGSRWENTFGTDHRLALALAAQHSVLWVDPPVPWAGPAEVDRPPARAKHNLDAIAPGILRLRVLVPPGPYRVGLRIWAGHLMQQGMRQALQDTGARPVVTLSLSPTLRLPVPDCGVRVLHVTDDWLAGAALMGLSRRYIAGILRRNFLAADIVTAVTPPLVSMLQDMNPRARVELLPNGCDIEKCSPVTPAQSRTPAVALMGQLNERLDFDLLGKIADTGIPIHVIGPRRDHDVVTARLLSGFLARPNVTWFGEVPVTEVSRLLRRATVGITPYLSSDFNRASFPLKTLEYLAAGLPVVATDSPAVRWLDTGLIRIGRTTEEFVSLTVQHARWPVSEEQRRQNQAFARLHSWSARAAHLMKLTAPFASSKEISMLGGIGE
ncbi:glycosyltransferase [Arthrobacter sp. OV608]|uniref:glycosyltransferase n=1 Tax=Arthrobacter sp. OV608 TaxID=1882768 RepID=UPI0008ACF45E|nr:glycosyltransferase [Arthrobacter sp. OV608]SEQ51219.1 teichuronic acid biosynthesis glycosyltransferase TuaH [Arthrobacter sp. OV608]